MAKTKTTTEIKSEPDTVKRTNEIEEFTNLHFIHPISMWLVPKFADRGISPNIVSLMGLVFGLLAGISYYFYQNPIMAIAGFIFMILWHIMDGADGQLARLTNSQSDIGMVLDGVCDYVTFISVYVGIALALSAPGVINYEPYIWYIVLTSGLLHAVQSGAYELQRSEYDYWGYGKQSSALPDIAQMTADLKGKSFLAALASRGHLIYLRMQRRSSGIDQKFRGSLTTILQENPVKEGEIRTLYREIFAPGVNTWSIMCANYRTIAIFIACISAQPIYFFWFEIAILTPALVLLVQKQRLLNQVFSLRLKEITTKTGKK